MKAKAPMAKPSSVQVAGKSRQTQKLRRVRQRLVRPRLWAWAWLSERRRGAQQRPSKRPLVARKYWRWLPTWIALHAERGLVRKCWEGHRLHSAAQDGRKYGACAKCSLLPEAGAPIHVCSSCCWSVCAACAALRRLPSLQDDPLFQGRDAPCLLLPTREGGREFAPGGGTVIICPGGNYEFLCPNEGMPVADLLSGHGINAVVLRYRLLPAHSLDDALKDLSDAVDEIRRTRRGPVAAIGFSAGGHLVASHAINQARLGRRGLDAQVLVYPAIDGTEWLDPEKCGWFDYDNCVPVAPSLLAHQAALLGGPGFAAPPTLLVASTGDAVCPPEAHADPYAEVLKKRRVDHVYLRRNFGMHGFDLRGGWTQRCVAWLKASGFGSVDSRAASGGG